MLRITRFTTRALGCAASLVAVLMVGTEGNLAASTPPSDSSDSDSADTTAGGLGDNAETPPMGWSSWNAFGCEVSAELIEEMADAMVASGMRDAGYEYVNIDDCWSQGARDTEGNLLANPETFPEGIAGVADYLHSVGLKLGIYSSAGTTTCQQVYPGSLGYEYIDARNYYEWGVDYIKYDNCGGHALDDTYDPATTWMPEDIGAGELDAERRYARMGLAIAEVQAEAEAAGDTWDVVYSLCEWGSNDPWTWGTGVGGHLWRTTFDISDSFSSVLSILDQQVGLESFSRPNAWNDPDMLEVGNGGMTVAEYQSHFSLWALLNAPLIAGNDIRTIDEDQERASDSAFQSYLDILTNPDVIAVNQDWGGKQGYLLRDDGDTEVWVKPMSDGSAVAVVLFNRGVDSATVTVTAQELAEAGLASGELFAVDDLWADSVVSTTSAVRSVLAPHSSSMLLVRPTEGESGSTPAVTLSVAGDAFVEAGSTAQVDVTVFNDGAQPLTGVAVAVTGPDGWTLEATQDAPTTLAAGSEMTLRYLVSAGVETGEFEIGASLDYTTADPVVEESRSGSFVVQSVAAPPRGDHSLSGLPWAVEANSGEEPIGRDVSTTGEPITINGTVYSSGIGTLAPSSVVVYLGGSCSTLVGAVGIQEQGEFTGGPPQDTTAEADSATEPTALAPEGSDPAEAPGAFQPPEGAASFSIVGDGDELWSSDGTIAASSDAVEFSIDVTGVRVLELTTEGSGGFITFFDYATWLDTVVTCTGSEADG